MKITNKNEPSVVELGDLNYGEVFTLPASVKDFYIVIQPDFELDEHKGVYCVELTTGWLFCLDEARQVIPVDFEGIASF